MDFHLKQWRNQHESEEQHSTKMPKLHPESHHHQHQQSSASALPLFVPEPNSKVSTLSDSPLAPPTNRFPSKITIFFLRLLFISSFCDRNSQKVKFLIQLLALVAYYFSSLLWTHLSSFGFNHPSLVLTFFSLFSFSGVILSLFFVFIMSVLGMGSHFSLSQWQELELQALIFRHMLAGVTVPPELLHPIKKSLLHSPPYFLHHPLQHYQPAACKCYYCHTRFSIW